MPRFMKSLNNISRSQALFRKMRLGGELTSAQQTYVLAICRNPGRTQDELAADICVNKSTVARRLDWFCENGYVTRVQSGEDKRRQLVYPTEKMLALLPGIREANAEWSDIITEGIDAEELRIFHSVLMKIEERAKRATSGEGEF